MTKPAQLKEGDRVMRIRPPPGHYVIDSGPPIGTHGTVIKSEKWQGDGTPVRWDGWPDGWSEGDRSRGHWAFLRNDLRKLPGKVVA